MSVRHSRAVDPVSAAAPGIRHTAQSWRARFALRSALCSARASFWTSSVRNGCLADPVDCGVVRRDDPYAVDDGAVRHILVSVCVSVRLRSVEVEGVPAYTDEPLSWL